MGQVSFYPRSLGCLRAVSELRLLRKRLGHRWSFDDALETSLHIEAWKTKCPKTGWQYALEFEVQYASVKGVCWKTKLVGHRLDTTFSMNLRGVSLCRRLTSLACTKGRPPLLPRSTPCNWKKKKSCFAHGARIAGQGAARVRIAGRHFASLS